MRGQCGRYTMPVVGVHTEAALIQTQCGFRGPCNALNMHSTSMGDMSMILKYFLFVRTGCKCSSYAQEMTIVYSH